MQKAIKAGFIEVILVLFLYFHTFWHLIYWERSTASVFVSFFLLGIILLISIVIHWNGFASMGFHLHIPLAGLKEVFMALGLFFVVCMAILVLKHRPGKWPDWQDFFTFFLWGTLQQFVIQCFFFHRYLDMTSSRWNAIFLAAVTFSLLHIPNFDLMVITFLGGIYLSYLFSRWKNVILVGFVHGMISLIIITTLKPAHVISDNYRVGPDPLGPIRQTMTRYLREDFRLGIYVPSGIPHNVRDHFHKKVKKIETLPDLISFIKQKEPYFVILSQAHYDELRHALPNNHIRIWQKSLMWRRKFKNDKFDSVKAICRFDWQALNRLYRLPVVLISNEKRPNG